MRWVYGRLVLGAAAAGAVWLACSRTSAAKIAPAYADLPASHAHDKWMGVASCSSSACHGGDGPTRAKRSEYTTWAAHDKHARAYRVLFEERSRRIARNLPEPDGRLVEAHEKALCLKCHSSNNGEEGGEGSRLFRADGVGCETCHGPAERWLTAHYQAGFNEKSAADKARLGLLPTKDLTFRAKQCVACHIGNSEQEVNHDLIAAGHPRLSFEYAAYLAIYPKHWNPADERQRYPDFAARAWIIGQLTSAQAALDLLQARAEGAGGEEKKRKPWPEFSEYDCFACHKDLKVNSPRQLAGYGDRQPGAFPWGTWYLTMPSTFARQPGQDPSGFESSLKTLREEMQKPSPSAVQVAPKAEKVSRILGAWLDRVASESSFKRSAIERLMAGFLRDGEARGDAMDWDQAAQLYLAVASLNSGLENLELAPPQRAEQEEALAAIQNRLRRAFPPDSNSPSCFDPLDKPRLAEQFKTLREGLAK